MRITRPVLLLTTISACVFLVTQWNGSVAQQPSTSRKPKVKPVAQVAPANDDQKEGNKEAEGKDEDGALDRFMRQKLAASSRILEGLMIDDLTAVAENADRLLDMSKEERWRASNDMMYLQHSTQFRTAVKDLYEKAEEKSIDGVSLAWVNVTMSCIKCHEWVRNVVLADLEASQSTPRIQ